MTVLFEDFLAIQITNADNGLQETFDSREGDSGNIYLTQHVISGTSNLRA